MNYIVLLFILLHRVLFLLHREPSPCMNYIVLLFILLHRVLFLLHREPSPCMNYIVLLFILAAHPFLKKQTEKLEII